MPRSFLKILHVLRHRFNTISKKMFMDGNTEEKRGGHHDSLRERFEGQKEDIKKFINSLELKESHYCRSTTERKYLTYDLNVEKLFKLYQIQTELKEVKTSYTVCPKSSRTYFLARIQAARSVGQHQYFISISFWSVCKKFQVSSISL